MSKDLGITYKKEHTKLLAFIKARIAAVEDAEDILQDVFIQALISLDPAEPIHNLMAWLYTVARNRIIDWYRRKKLPITSMDTETGEVTFGELIAGSRISLEDEYIHKVVSETLIDCIEELPEEQQEVFILQAVEGRSFREIAEMLDISINTAMSRKRYAVAFLKKRLADIKQMLEE
jgi:RNA polymerase sigma factor (sigma-70 family)